MSDPVSLPGPLREAPAPVAGFDPERREWIPRGAPRSGVPLPPLSGTLLTDPQTLDDAADDFGHLHRRRPLAVLRPGSVEDVQAMVRYARRLGLKVGARGQRHTVFGQSLAAEGIVVETSALNAPPVISRDRVEVAAGVLWRDLIAATLAHGLTAPVLTGYLGLSVGGTLSVGGIGGSSFRYGAQVDNVLALRLVTGEGEVRDCSPERDPDLFEAALAGLGQVGIIVSATLRLVPAHPMARMYLLFYADLPTMLQDERTLADDGRFDEVVGFVVPAPEGGWMRFITAAAYHTPPEAPDDQALLAGLSFLPGAQQVIDLPYLAYVSRVDAEVSRVEEAGRIGLPHPWLDLFVPDSEIDGYAVPILETLTHADSGPDWPILFFPLKSERFTRPLLRVPDEETFWLFDILRTAPDAATGEEMVARNRALYDEARERGSTHYTISAIPLSPQDWKRHFQPHWGALTSAKRRYDPDGVMTPGPGIF